MTFKDAYLKKVDEQIGAYRARVLSGSSIDDHATYREAIGRIFGLETARELFVDAFQKYATDAQEEE